MRSRGYPRWRKPKTNSSGKYRTRRWSIATTWRKMFSRSLARRITDTDFEPEIFDDNETLYPVSTRSQKEFDDLYLLSIRRIAREHLEDTQLMETVTKSMEQKKSRFTWKEVERNEVIHTFGKIYVPAAARNRLIEWRVYQTNKLSYSWPRLRKDYEEYTKTCHECQIA